MRSFSLPCLTVSLCALFLACEGEPPKVPSGVAMGRAAAPAPEEPATAPDAAAPDVVEATAAVVPSPCPTPNGGDAGEADAAPPAPVLGSVSGKLTTTPPKAAAAAVVYFEDAPIDPNAKMTASIDNRSMNFIPYVQVVPLGGKVKFVNSDPFPHNVFSPDTDRFDLGSIAQHSAAARTFKKAGSYSLLCNLHPGMLGYLVVTPSSYFAKVDASGVYKIADVPAGTYKLTAWAPRLPTSTQTVTIKEGDTTVDFELHR